MTPWIFVTLALIILIGVIKLVMMWKIAKTQPAVATGETPTMTNRRALEWALALVAVSFLTVGYSDMSLWFLPVVIYAAIWLPQVSRKIASPRQAVYVGAAFGAAMIAATLIQIFVWR